MAPKLSIDHFIKFRLLSCCWNTKLTTTVQQIYSFIVSNNIVSFSWWFRKFCFEHVFNRWQFRSTRPSSSTYYIISIFHFSSHMFSTCVTWKYYDGSPLRFLINVCIQEKHNRIFWRLQENFIDKTLCPILILKGHKLYTDSIPCLALPQLSMSENCFGSYNESLYLNTCSLYIGVRLSLLLLLLLLLLYLLLLLF